MGNSRKQFRALAGCGVVMMAAACATTAGMEASAGADGASVNASATVMTDANVAAVAHAANMDEIQTSQVALQRSQNAQVRQFAQMMTTEHTAVDQQMMQMLQARNMAPQPNAPAQAAMQATRATVANLSQRSGMDFDRAYTMHQVNAHRWTLTSLDQTLIPSTRDPEMKEFLTTRVRPGVAMHLETAQRINASMGGSAGTGN
jgi:putative membrane protein